MTPKQAGFRMPAEWHPHEGCWMAWPCREETWEKIGLERARIAYAKVANTIAEFEPVNVLVNPSERVQATALCNSTIRLIPHPINDSWTRDTGPTFLLNAQRELGAVDWIHNAWGKNYEDYVLDNQIAKAVIELTEAHYFHAPLVMEGGSFHVDGQGTILTTRECLLNPNRNPYLSQKDIEDYLLDYLGGEKIIWLNKGLLGDETNGHIDELACFIAPGKVLALHTEDKHDPNYYTLQENLELLRTATDASGRRLDVYPVEQPPATYLGGERLTLSYINFYFANNAIVMPSFECEKQDQAALNLFTQLFPNFAIKQINALDVFAGGGGIHCITQQQPKATLRSMTKRM
ncbi:agmatine deiminase family protein [Legionella yabuuchiae]|uniref:agmatine deiminase family protein n=1 Tax=Legionella yabuuchiae TaxID=376727 RepID=UPI001054F7A2|nr:agmatine deiminase family protein [Legionella yabuuchiae]